jgi:uncharacterized membrane protein
MIRAKTAIFAGIAVMTAYVIYHNERFLIDPGHPAWTHYRKVGWWLVPHGVAGACALLLAPLQFSDRLRRRHTRLHRVVGRIYVAGVFILAPIGAYIQYFEETLGFSRSFTILAAADAALLCVTTAIAFVFALQRRIPQHRRWMTRSYAVGLVFFEGRFILGVTGWETLGAGIVEAVIWTCLVFSILLADIANEWAELRAAVSPGRATPALAAPVRDAIGSA